MDARLLDILVCPICKANLEYRKAVEATFDVAGQAMASGRAFEIAPEDLRQSVNQDQPNVFAPREAPLTATWRFPPLA